MHSYVVNITFILFTMIVNSGAVAPGDEQELCTKTLRASGSAPIPAYADTMKVLMDSWNYQNLLPPQLQSGSGAVWSEVTDPGLSALSAWTQSSSQACQQTIQYCGDGANFPDVQLTTQLINRTVNGTRLPQVSLTIETSLPLCGENCSYVYMMYKLDTSTPNPITYIENYQQFGEVNVTTGNTKVNQTIAVVFDTNSGSTLTSFYLGMRVPGSTCGFEVSRIIVFYHVCPSQLKDLIHHPLTIAPAGNTSQTTLLSIFVNGSCVENAQPENGLNPVLICSSDGTWAKVSGLGCECMDGYREDNDICIRFNIEGTNQGVQASISCAFLLLASSLVIIAYMYV